MPEHATVQRLARLIHRHLREDITEKEQEELSSWVEGSGKRDLFDQLTSEVWLEKELPSYTEYEQQAGEDWKKIEESLFKRNLLVRVRAIPLWILYAAVGIFFFGLIVIGIRLFLVHPSQITPPILADNLQIKPSKISAMLFLQDGTIIQMENDRSGIVATQGPIKVVKKKGQLLYLKKNSVADSSMPEYKSDQDFTSGPLMDSPGTTRKSEQLVTQLEDNRSFTPINTLKVMAGGQIAISLPDGSRIWLNAESILRYPVQFTGPERKVYLSGEAYFEVSSNPSRPFIVSVRRENDSAAMEFQAIGTKFNIRAYDDEPGIITTVVEGTVKALSVEQTYMIPLHSQLQWKDASYVVVKTEKDKVVAGWKDNYFDLDGSTIGEVMNVIKRWYGIEVIMNADSKRKFTGKLTKSTPFQDIVEVLKTNGYRVDIVGKIVTISDK